MRRLVLLFAVATLMAVVLSVGAAVPAFAQQRCVGQQASFLGPLNNPTNPLNISLTGGGLPGAVGQGVAGEAQQYTGLGRVISPFASSPSPLGTSGCPSVL